MRARRLAASALLVAAGLAAGCLKRSPAARTYVLDPMPDAAAAEAAPAPVAVVGVERVQVPDWLDRPQVAGRAASGEVLADEFSRWGEPLPRGIQRVLVENLVLLLPDRRVVSAPFSPRDRVDLFVEVTVLDATRQADGSVVLDCRFAVLASDGGVLARRRASHRASAPGPGTGGAVAGLNEALASLGRELADVLRGQTPLAAPGSKAE
jgi:uncharacterized lipoprotein YmbA